MEPGTASIDIDGVGGVTAPQQARRSKACDNDSRDDG